MSETPQGVQNPLKRKNSQLLGSFKKLKSAWLKLKKSIPTKQRSNANSQASPPMMMIPSTLQPS
jgi:hypothetical protein